MIKNKKKTVDGIDIRVLVHLSPVLMHTYITYYNKHEGWSDHLHIRSDSGSGHRCFSCIFFSVPFFLPSAVSFEIRQ